MHFTLLMERLTSGYAESSYSVQQASTEDSLNWDNADLDELQSLVLDDKVFMATPMPTTKRAITMKWVRKQKTSGRLKSRLVDRGFNMI